MSADFQNELNGNITGQDGLLPGGAWRILAAVALLVVAHLSATAVYRVYFHPLSRFPGPRTWAMTDLPFARAFAAGRAQRAMLALHRRHGPVVRIGPADLSYCDAAAWRDVYAYRKGHAEFSKSAFVMVPPPNGVPGILGAGQANHRRYRKLLAASFSDKAMRAQSPTILRHVDLLMERLGEHAAPSTAKGEPQQQQQQPVDLVEWFNRATFDVIGALAFGDSFRCLETSSTHSWIRAVFASVKAGNAYAAATRLGLARLAPLLVSKQAREVRLRNMEYSADKIRQRLEKGSDCGDFWDNVLKHQDAEDRLTADEMASIASNLVLGGSETTATLLAGCCYLLMRHPRVLEKVVAELRAHFAAAPDIDLFSVARLRYTLAVLDETMRLYPPVPEQASRVVPGPAGDTVDGQYLPPGTQVHLPQVVANRLEANFTRPDEFIPERFLADDNDGEDNGFRHDRFDVLQPFSVGPRNCIGKNLAYAEMRLLLARILWHFEFELVDDQVDWLDQRIYLLWEKKPLMVRLRNREMGPSSR